MAKIFDDLKMKYGSIQVTGPIKTSTDRLVSDFLSSATFRSEKEEVTGSEYSAKRFGYFDPNRLYVYTKVYLHDKKENSKTYADKVQREASTEGSKRTEAPLVFKPQTEDNFNKAKILGENGLIKDVYLVANFPLKGRELTPEEKDKIIYDEKK